MELEADIYDEGMDKKTGEKTMFCEVSKPVTITYTGETFFVDGEKVLKHEITNGGYGLAFHLMTQENKEQIIEVFVTTKSGLPNEVISGETLSTYLMSKAA